MLGMTKGEWFVAEQEAQVTNALLESPKSDAELMAALGTTQRRIRDIMHRLHLAGEVTHSDGKWSFRREVIEHGEDHGEDETTQL